MDKITVKVSGQMLKEIPLSTAPNAEYKMGRDLNNEIVVEDQKASRLHTKLIKENGRYFAMDMGSTNGSYINETEMLPANQKRELFHKDVITIGDHAYVFDLPSLCDTAIGDGDSKVADWAREAMNEAQNIPDAGAAPQLPDVGSAAMAEGGMTKKLQRFEDSGADALEPTQEVQSDPQAIAKLNAHLLVVNENEREVYELKQQEIKVGRDASNDICIPHHSISGTHAKFYFMNGRFVVEDLRSTNGTMANGTLIHKQAIQSPALIVFGDVVCLYSTDVGVGDDEKTLRQLTKNLSSQGLMSKKQIKNAMRESGSSSVRDVGEHLIMSGAINPDSWVQALKGGPQMAGSKKKSSMGLIIGVLAVLLIAAVAGGAFFILQKKDKEVKNFHVEAAKLAKEAKTKAKKNKTKALILYKKAEEAFEKTRSKMKNSTLTGEDFKKKVNEEYYKTLLSYTELLLQKGKSEEGNDKLRTLFKAKDDAVKAEAAQILAKVYYDKAKSSSAGNREKYLTDLVYSHEEIGFDNSLIEDDQNYMRAVVDLGELLFVQGHRLFGNKDSRKKAVENWKGVKLLLEPVRTKEALPEAFRQKAKLYYSLAELGIQARELILAALNSSSNTSNLMAKFKSNWDQLKIDFPDYQQILKKNKIDQVVFKVEVDKIKPDK